VLVGSFERIMDRVDRSIATSWLLPVTAFALWTMGWRTRVLGLHAIFAPVLLAAGVGLLAAAWLIASRPRLWTVALAGVVGIGIVVSRLGILSEAGLAWTTTDRLIVASVAGAIVGTGLWFGRRRATLTPLDLTIGVSVIGMLIADWVTIHSQFGRDLGIYLDAGAAFGQGGHPYLSGPMTTMPKDLSQLPFLYPPLTLPFFDILAGLPRPLVISGWLLGQVAVSVLALRLLGLRSGWAIFLVLWPPILQGIWVGNVAIWMFALLAVGRWWPSLLGLLPAFKFQTVIIGLWWVRERRWRSMLIAGGLLAGLALATLPIVGVGAWTDWFHGLQAFEQTTARFPGLQGSAIAAHAGELVAIGVGGILVIIGFRLRQGASLGTFALASIAVSPTVYWHGLTLAIPAFLRARAALVWLLLLAAFLPLFHAHLWSLLLVAGGLGLVGSLQHDASSAEADWHPIGRASEPWPASSRPSSPSFDHVPGHVEGAAPG
jgi:hypothetical protein